MADDPATELLEREAETGPDRRGAARGGGRSRRGHGDRGGGRDRQEHVDGRGRGARGGGGMAVLRARGSMMEREFALGVVIQLLAPASSRSASASAKGCSPAPPGSRGRCSRTSPIERPPTIACSRASTGCTGCAPGSPRCGRSPCSSTTRTGPTSIRCGSSTTSRRGSRRSPRARSSRSGPARRGGAGGPDPAGRA